MKFDFDSKLSRTMIGKKLQEYININNLKGNINNKKKIDKRIYRMDDKLEKLFNLDKNKLKIINESIDSRDPNGFNFFNYHSWIKKLYLEEKIDI